MGKAGYLRLIIPEEYGGQGKGIRENAQIITAFAEYNPSAALCYMMHNVAIAAVMTCGQDKLKEKMLKDIVENNVFCGLAGSEFTTGVHFNISTLDSKREGEYTVVSGKKSMITSGGYASYFLITAKQPEDGETGYWILPMAETDGVTFEAEKWNGVGMRGNVSGPMVLDQVKLHDDNRIAEGMAHLFYFIVGLAGVYTGITKAQARLAIQHAKDRKYPDGKRLADIESVQVYLSKLYTMANASER